MTHQKQEMCFYNTKKIDFWFYRMWWDQDDLLALKCFTLRLLYSKKTWFGCGSVTVKMFTSHRKLNGENTTDYISEYYTAWTLAVLLNLVKIYDENVSSVSLFLCQKWMWIVVCLSKKGAMQWFPWKRERNGSQQQKSTKGGGWELYNESHCRIRTRYNNTQEKSTNVWKWMTENNIHTEDSCYDLLFLIYHVAFVTKMYLIQQ